MCKKWSWWNKVSARKENKQKTLLVTEQEDPGYSGFRKPWIYLCGSFIIIWTSGLDRDSNKTWDEKKAKIKWPHKYNGVSYYDVVKVLPILSVYFWWMGRSLESIHRLSYYPGGKNAICSRSNINITGLMSHKFSCWRLILEPPHRELCPAGLTIVGKCNFMRSLLLPLFITTRTLEYEKGLYWQ